MSSSRVHQIPTLICICSSLCCDKNSTMTNNNNVVQRTSSSCGGIATNRNRRQSTRATMPMMMMMLLVLIVMLCNWFSSLHGTDACSDILVTPGASQDGSAMIGYNADDVSLYGVLYHYPATTDNEEGMMIPVYNWDTGKYLGQIPQVQETYNVVGNANEYGLVIGESTFGGVQEVATQPGAIIDYGSLIYLTLQRAKTAREAIATMDQLMTEYGYASEGESISIADALGEVWIMEVIGRGPTYGKKGGVWVARKVPDGMITAHANQARITTFPRNDPDTCLYAKDVVDVAVHYGLYTRSASSPKDGHEVDMSNLDDSLDFSFSDVYDPVTFSGARFSEARVWSMLSKVADMDGTFQMEYQDYVSGRNLTKRMPLFVKPYKKLSLVDVMDLMTSHYEGTELDATVDVGGGIFGSPHRPRPLTWKYQGNQYFNERTLATERTGWNFVAQIRPEMPRELAAVVWFAVDDSSTSPRFPFYASSTDVAEPYAGKGTQDGVPGPMLTLDMKKAFWVQNLVSNFAYFRWHDAYPFVRKRIDAIHSDFQTDVQKMDEKALAVYHDDSAAAAVKLVTQFSVDAGQQLHEEWLTFFGELFVRFRDFSTIVPDAEDSRCGCSVQQPGLTDANKRRIVMETGTHYEMPSFRMDREGNSANAAWKAVY